MRRLFAALRITNGAYIAFLPYQSLASSATPEGRLALLILHPNYPAAGTVLIV
jgi:hypothetical protein